MRERERDNLSFANSTQKITTNHETINNNYYNAIIKSPRCNTFKTSQ